MFDPLLERLRRALAPEFDVDRPLASGGMGTVFLGREIALGRRVAIKILKPEIATADAEERFLREAQILAGFNHPNIVPIFRPHRADGIPLYMMPFLEGETLAARLERGPLPAAEAVRLAADLLSALDEAHRHGVVHRDVKPSNIFLLADRAVLTDFGVAKTSTGGEGITHTGQQIGTPAYMSPEQLAGGQITPATDLYATGMVLYRALTGRDWQPLEHPVAANWDGVPRPLARALQRALALHPGERWQSAAALRREFRVDRRRASLLPWALLALSAAGIAVGVAAWRRWIAPAAARPEVAVRPFTVAPGVDSSLGEDVAGLTADLLRGSGLSVAPRAAMSRAARFVEGRIAQADSVLYLTVQVRTAAGDTIASRQLRAGDRWGLADSAAFVVFHAARPRAVLPPDVQCRPKSVEAQAAYFAGVAAFRADDWGTAEQQFAQAVRRDPDFCLAEWRLWTVQRWRRSPETVNLARLSARHGQQLPRADRLVIEAELAPEGATRRARYQAAVAADPFGGVAPLFYGSELFHRGPLSGTPLDSAVLWLRVAIQRDSSVAPAYDQLIWALIRLGRQEDARLTLEAVRGTVVAGADRAVPPEVFALAYLARFDPPAFARSFTQEGAGAGLPALARFVRVGLSLDVAEAQKLIGAELAGRADLPADARAQGVLAEAMGLLALGAPQAALVRFDSAAALVPLPELALEAAAWRALGPALGVVGITDTMQAVGQARLTRLAETGPVAARAAWSLALAALTAGDTAAGREWQTRAVGARLAPPLATLLDAYLAAARGDRRRALRISTSLLEQQDRNRLGDPFARALLNLGRAAWLEAEGDQGAALRTRRWHNNADFVGWLSGPIQSAEVDWVVGVFVRWRDAARRVAAGDLSACAELLRVRDVWAEAEPAVRALVNTRRDLLATCGT